ncbi:MAG: SDR family oxidoreductase [Woeseiaceae bacterium]
MMTIKDTTVVLTGASGGIGRAIAERLAVAGARLILVGRSGDKLRLLMAELGGETHTAIVADIGSEEGRLHLRDRCDSLAPEGISLLVNCAGVNDFGLFEEQSQAAIAETIGINLISPILICQDLLPLLHRRGQAQIVNIGSTFGSIGYPGFSAYCASKFGLRGFTESLRRELADSGIQVSYVAPRATQTDLNSDKLVAMNNELGTAMDKPSVVADQVMRVITCRSGLDRYMGWPEKLFVKINALLPALVDSSLRKQLPVIRRFARHQI